MIRLAGGFINGFVNGLVVTAGRTAVDMLEDAGRGAILSAVGGGALGQIVGGAFEYLDRMESALNRQQAKEIRTQQKEDRIARAQHRINHMIWLEQNRWRFDWRSQPRHPAGTSQGGEWMPGRLDYQVGVKNLISRKDRRLRMRAIRAYRARRRAMGETRFRQPVVSFGSEQWQ